MSEIKKTTEEPGKCPVCGSQEVDYPDSVAHEHSECCYYNMVCKDCGATAREWYSMTFVNTVED